MLILAWTVETPMEAVSCLAVAHRHVDIDDPVKSSKAEQLKTLGNFIASHGESNNTIRLCPSSKQATLSIVGGLGGNEKLTTPRVPVAGTVVVLTRCN